MLQSEGHPYKKYLCKNITESDTKCAQKYK